MVSVAGIESRKGMNGRLMAMMMTKRVYREFDAREFTDTATDER